MKKSVLLTHSLILIVFAYLSSCTDKKNEKTVQFPQEIVSTTYKPDNQSLYDSILMMDSIFFDAYNHCNLEKQAALYSDSIEFYHDQNGLINSKQKLLDDTKKYICGKVTRELIKTSVEVYPIKGYGAIEMGMHQFHNNQEKNDKPHPSRFTILWNRTASGWKMDRVISLH